MHPRFAAGRMPAQFFNGLLGWRLLRRDSMGHVKGIGGLFFRARDPNALNAWYRERLGVGGGCSADDSVPPNEWVWNVTAGPLVFTAFKADSDYFSADKQHMINL